MNNEFYIKILTEGAHFCAGVAGASTFLGLFCIFLKWKLGGYG